MNRSNYSPSSITAGIYKAFMNLVYCMIMVIPNFCLDEWHVIYISFVIIAPERQSFGIPSATTATPSTINSTGEYDPFYVNVPVST